MNNENHPGHYVSTQTASMLTGKSVRTLQRWQDEGIISGVEREGVRRGAGGVKLMLDLDKLESYIPVPFHDEKKEMAVRADSGDAEAMNELGIYFYTTEQYAIAVPWFEGAAAKGHADAVDWLANCYFKGLGVEKNQAMGLKWLGEAAVRGHVIAKFKVDQLHLT